MKLDMTGKFNLQDGPRRPGGRRRWSAALALAAALAGSVGGLGDAQAEDLSADTAASPLGPAPSVWPPPGEEAGRASSRPAPKPGATPRPVPAAGSSAGPASAQTTKPATKPSARPAAAPTSRPTSASTSTPTSKPATKPASSRASSTPAPASRAREAAAPAAPAKGASVAAERAGVAAVDGLRLQLALDRALFSPGLLDGKPGAKTIAALALWRSARGARAGDASTPDAAAAVEALGDLATTTTQTITQEDLDAVSPIPKDWNARAKLRRMTYESLPAMLAERGHCTRALLQRLNPGLDLERLVPGDVVTLPNVGSSLAGPRGPRAERLEVDLSAKTVTAYGEGDRPAARFHCSIAKFVENRPRGQTAVKAVALEPDYTFDPRMWPEVKTVRQKLKIPPGPRNPVGLAWVGLELPGYGIHGTPNPELIGKTGSHGCIRLTNWDAIRLARMVKAGTPVRFVQ